MNFFVIIFHFLKQLRQRDQHIDKSRGKILKIMKTVDQGLFLFNSEGKIHLNGHYTGVITISGNYKGVCYFSAPEVFLSEIITSIGESDNSKEMIIDTVGEVANILSGSAQSSLGRGFIISTPRVYQGKASAQSFAQVDTYAIPIHWKSLKSHICVAVA